MASTEGFRWMTEKMDGVRGYWDGEKLLSRQGKPIHCPEWFSEGLPNGVRLEGELWMGRETLDKMRSLLNTSLPESGSDPWKGVEYVLFDILDSELAYEQRMEKLKGLHLPSHVSVVRAEKCLGSGHLYERLRSIVNNDGEGLVLTKPESRYVGERTRSRLKVKVSFGPSDSQVGDESELRVLAVVPSGLYCLQ